MAMNISVVSPKANVGEEISYLPSRFAAKYKYKAPGVDGIKYGYVTVTADDSRLYGEHPAYDHRRRVARGDRALEKALAIEKQLNHPVQVLVADYSFAGRVATRYEVFSEKTHSARYAYRWVLYVDKETKLPVRFEAYDQPKPGGNTGGELIEVQSFLGIKANTGLGDSVFERYVGTSRGRGFGGTAGCPGVTWVARACRSRHSTSRGPISRRRR